MSSTTRTQCRYDHCLRELVQATGDVELAIRHGVPRSIAHGWLTKKITEVVSLDVLELDTVRIQHAVILLRRFQLYARAICRAQPLPGRILFERHSSDSYSWHGAGQITRKSPAPCGDNSCEKFQNVVANSSVVRQPAIRSSIEEVSYKHTRSKTNRVNILCELQSSCSESSLM